MSAEDPEKPDILAKPDPAISGSARQHSDFAPTKDLKNLQAALDELVAWVGGLTLPDDKVRVLDLACGDCQEAFTLSSWLSNLYHPIQPREVNFVGLDIREAELIKARNRCDAAIRWFEKQKWRPPWLNVDFRKFDVSTTSLSELVPEPADLVFIRHQNTWNGAMIWTQLFENALQAISESGCLIITSYYDQEHEQALELIRGLGGDVRVSMPNTHSRKLPRKGQSMDRHLALIQKGKALI